jgi:hypothetical protein
MQKERETISDLKLLNPSNFTKVDKIERRINHWRWVHKHGWKMDGWDDWHLYDLLRAK